MASSARCLSSPSRTRPRALAPAPATHATRSQPNAVPVVVRRESDGRLRHPCMQCAEKWARRPRHSLLTLQRLDEHRVSAQGSITLSLIDSRSRLTTILGPQLRAMSRYSSPPRVHLQPLSTRSSTDHQSHSLRESTGTYTHINTSCTCTCVWTHTEPFCFRLLSMSTHALR